MSQPSIKAGTSANLMSSSRVISTASILCFDSIQREQRIEYPSQSVQAEVQERHRKQGSLMAVWPQGSVHRWDRLHAGAARLPALLAAVVLAGVVQPGTGLRAEHGPVLRVIHMASPAADTTATVSAGMQRMLILCSLVDL